MELFGPLFFAEQSRTQRQWGIPPLGMSHTSDPDVDSEEFDFLYPVMTYDRYGEDYRWQLFQFWSFAGGRNQDDSGDHRFTLFPIYFQQRSTDPAHNYTALLPFYGQLQHRFYRDEIDFVLFPIYAKTRKKDILTYNLPFPLFHLRYGNRLRGWQLWPLAGRERKGVTLQTNTFGDLEVVGGHDKKFVLWPIYTETKSGIGTDQLVKQQGLIPFYALYRSPLRESTTYLWPLGYTHTVDWEKDYEEWDAPWPFVEFARGDGKTTSRIFPFFSQSHNQYLVDNWYMWPIYKYNRVVAPPADRGRTRILFFLYSYVNEQNTETGAARHRTDLWPFFTHRREFDGKERLQVLSVIEPLFPESKSVERDYGPLYALWRWEKDPRTGNASQSLLWNLYRRDTTPETKKISLLFGLFQYQSNPAGRQWRVFYLPLGKAAKTAAGPAPTATKNE